MNGIHISGTRKSIRKARNVIVRLLTSVLLIVSVFWTLDSFGFFNEAIEYAPTSIKYYHSSVFPSGRASYSGDGTAAAVSDSSITADSTDFRDGIVGTRSARTTIIGDGKDIFTVMIYMCGSDTESLFGSASEDLEEMMAATKSGKLNIIIQTGGSNSWSSASVKSGDCQRFKISKGKLTQLAAGSSVNMTNYANLASFIVYCKNNYPANRYALIFWGHGGGTYGGFGYDETVIDSDSMTIDEINQALQSANVKFDFIGFDSGLSANYETAYVMNFYADYLIASQAEVSSVGWNYTNWLTAIAENTSIETTEIAKIIIDDYAESCSEIWENNVYSLSLIDLTDFNNLVHPAMVDFFNCIDKVLNSGNYPYVANARAASREFGGTSADTIDLMDFAARINIDEGNQLVDALKSAVVYNSFPSGTVNANGLSLYFPLHNIESINSVMNILHRINICDEYFSTIRKFANISFGGRLYYSEKVSEILNTGISDNVAGYFSGFGEYGSIGSTFSWVDMEFIEKCETYYRNNTLKADAFDLIQAVCTEGSSYDVFFLGKEEWQLVSDIKVESYIYDDEIGCYISLGTHLPELNYLNEDLLHLQPEATAVYVSIDDVPVFAEVVTVEVYDTSERITYRVPASITTSDSDAESSEPFTYPADIYIVKEKDYSNYSYTYSIAYAEPVAADSAQARSKTVTLKDGDIITPQYTYLGRELEPIDDGSIEHSVPSITYTSAAVRINESSTAENCIVYYVFTDVYGNTFRTMV